MRLSSILTVLLVFVASASSLYYEERQNIRSLSMAQEGTYARANRKLPPKSNKPGAQLRSHRNLNPSKTRITQSREGGDRICRRTSNAVLDAISKKGGEIGKGYYGTVYSVKEKIDDKDVVLKEVDMGIARPSYLRKFKPNPRQEAKNLKQVNQLVAWGHDKNKNIYYFVMPKMGGPPSSVKPPLSVEEKKKLKDQCVERYLNEYHMKHRDVKEDNFVFHGTRANRKAELIDWGTADYVGQGPMADVSEPVDVISCAVAGASSSKA
ncbi:hypothetical protein AX15_003186 [Amanita polypyramis BW_CC]|nr:hypothetical protein AX15_003186 [Amanita polypyramis BW_CC]